MHSGGATVEATKEFVRKTEFAPYSVQYHKIGWYVNVSSMYLCVSRLSNACLFSFPTAHSAQPSSERRLGGRQPDDAGSCGGESDEKEG